MPKQNADSLAGAAGESPEMQKEIEQMIRDMQRLDPGKFTGNPELVERIRAEVDFPARCVATGGLAALIATEAKTIELTDELLTLKGLKLLFSRNHATLTT